MTAYTRLLAKIYCRCAIACSGGCCWNTTAVHPSDKVSAAEINHTAAPTDLCPSYSPHQCKRPLQAKPLAGACHLTTAPQTRPQDDAKTLALTRQRRHKLPTMHCRLARLRLLNYRLTRLLQLMLLPKLSQVAGPMIRRSCHACTTPHTTALELIQWTMHPLTKYNTNQE